MPIAQQTYIGDGVYAENQWSQVKLWTERQTGTHLIYMSPTELWNLLRFLTKGGWFTKEAFRELAEMVPQKEEDNEA
jgi:hypothetical protein